MIHEQTYDAVIQMVMNFTPYFITSLVFLILDPPKSPLGRGDRQGFWVISDTFQTSSKRGLGNTKFWRC